MNQNKAKLYRGVHPRVKDAIKAIARVNCVPADEISTAFLKALIEALNTEALVLEPQPVVGRMTLFPENEEPGWQYTQMPLLPTEATPIFRPAYRRNKRWQFTATYRVPEETHAQIIEIAREYMVGIGAVVSFSLQWGLQEYHEGRLKLAPRTLTIKQTLLFNGVPV